jgi:hypothetical protein
VERWLSEEYVTLNIMNWLIKNDWNIATFDYPNSGTGILLHSNINDKAERNKNGIIPDIIAVNNNTALFFENKKRFYKPDFEKLFEIKTKGEYSISLSDLLKKYKVKTIYYGVGLPFIEKEIEKSKAFNNKIDFLISIDKNRKIIIHHDVFKVFKNI